MHGGAACTQEAVQVCRSGCKQQTIRARWRATPLRRQGSQGRTLTLARRLSASVPLSSVSCCIMQRTGAAIHSAKACYWDTVSDGKNERGNSRLPRTLSGRDWELTADCRPRCRLPLLSFVSLRHRLLAQAQRTRSQQPNNAMHRHGICSIILPIRNMKQLAALVLRLPHRIACICICFSHSRTLASFVRNFDVPSCWLHGCEWDVCRKS